MLILGCFSNKSLLNYLEQHSRLPWSVGSRKVNMMTGLLSFLTFLLGLLLGNWLAIGRDKRKEFNEAVTPIRGWLLRARDKPSPYDRWPSEQEVDRFIHYLLPWQRSGFKKRLRRYQQLHSTLQIQDSVGQVFYSENLAIREELNGLFKYTKPR